MRIPKPSPLFVYGATASTMFWVIFAWFVIGIIRHQSEVIHDLHQYVDAGSRGRYQGEN